MRRQAPVDYASPNFHPPWLKRHFSAQLRVLGAAARRRQTGENSASAIDGLLQLAKSWNVAISSHLCRVQWIIQRLMDNRWGWAVRNGQRLQLLTAIIPNMLLDFIKKKTQQLFHKTRHLPLDQHACVFSALPWLKKNSSVKNTTSQRALKGCFAVARILVGSGNTPNQFFLQFSALVSAVYPLEHYV